MDNRIVYEPASKIREIARETLRGKWAQMFLGVLIYFALSVFVKNILDYFFGIVRYVNIGSEYMQITVSYASTLYDFLVSGALICGFTMFILTFFRTREIDYSLNLEGFGMFGKAFVLYLLYSVKIALWGLLFIIPGIVAVFRYSMCFCLRVDNPDWTASQCIKESTRLMRGNKSKLFGLYFSFIGWAFLASFIGSGIDILFDVSGFAYVILGFFTSVPVMFLRLYMETSTIAFYEILTGNLVVAGPEGIPYANTSPDNETWEDVKERKHWDENDGGDDNRL